MHHLERFGHDIARGYQHHIVDEHKVLQMLILITFLITFVCVRFITHAIRAGRYRRVFRNVSGPGGTHLHHLVPASSCCSSVAISASGSRTTSFGHPSRSRSASAPP